ncbi:MAG: FtsB family cell division protein [Jatrophihabitans sp.]|uniref:FtsB family cell division protein n=1 Tax=Jatrophihabitans sp. TaxID=1932789 RepID=UPI003F817A4D
MAWRESAGRARPVVTGRALVLGGVVVLLVVLLASPLHRYLASRGEVAAAGRQLHDDQRELSALTRQKARWNDPGYIQQQARERLQFAMPGDTVYVVVDKGAKTDIEKTAGTGTAQAAKGTTWNARLWNSIDAASK